MEVAEVASGEGFRPIHALRYRAGQGDVRYLADTDANLDFHDEETLQFSPRDSLRIAQVRVQIQPSPPTGSKPIYEATYHILVEEESGYTYARISEARTGEARVADHFVPILARPAGRDDPLFGIGSGTRLFVDRNRDGQIQEAWSLADDGTLVASEEVDVLHPFLIGGQTWRVTELDQAGTRLQLRPSTDQVAPVEGFRAPAIDIADLDGNRHTLANYLGRTVLVEFWSVSCTW